MSVLSGGRPTETDREVVRTRLARFSPVALVTDKAPPTIALYGETHKVKGIDVGTDGIVARQNYDALTNRLTTVGATFTAKLTRYPHCQALGLGDFGSDSSAQAKPRHIPLQMCRLPDPRGALGCTWLYGSRWGRA